MFTNKTVWIEILREVGISVGVILVAAILTSLLGSWIRAAADEVVEHKQLNATLEMHNQVIIKLSQEYKQVRGNESRIRAALLPSSNILEFIGALESIALKDNITESVHFDTPREVPLTIGEPPVSLEQIAFTLPLQGNIFTFLEYLKDFERLPYFTKVEGISISATPQGGLQNTSNISLRGSIYTRSEE